MEDSILRETMMALDLDYSYRDEAREAERRQLREAAKKRLCPRCTKLSWCSPYEVCVEVKIMEKTLSTPPQVPSISPPNVSERPTRLPSF